MTSHLLTLTKDNDHVHACGCKERVPDTSEDEDEVFARGTPDTPEVVLAETVPQALPEPVTDISAEPTVTPTNAPEPVVFVHQIISEVCN